MSLPLIVDASVALKWVLDEDDSPLARTLARRILRRRICSGRNAPTACGGGCERGVALSKRVARERFAALRRAPVVLTPTAGLLDRALILAIDLGHPIYDCIYLALALNRGMQVVSADRRFVNAVRGRVELSGVIVLLAEMAH